MSHRPIYEIAADIRADYADAGKSVHYSAKPYVDAMMYLDTVNDSYFEDSARTVLTYAVSNLSSWRGPVARAVKQEIRDILSRKG